jgi:hypothetical protein
VDTGNVIVLPDAHALPVPGPVEKLYFPRSFKKLSLQVGIVTFKLYVGISSTGSPCAARCMLLYSCA